MASPEAGLEPFRKCVSNLTRRNSMPNLNHHQLPCSHQLLLHLPAHGAIPPSILPSYSSPLQLTQPGPIIPAANPVPFPVLGVKILPITHVPTTISTLAPGPCLSSTVSPLQQGILPPGPGVGMFQPGARSSGDDLPALARLG